jgi:hypothetical protein
VGKEEPCNGAFDGSFEVLGKTPASPEPCECSLDDPAPGQELEALYACRSLDDLDGPFAKRSDGSEKLITAIDAVGEDVAELGKALP